jgi:hypothetical protein
MKISKKRILALALAITTTTTQMSIANAEAPTAGDIAAECELLKLDIATANEVLDNPANAANKRIAAGTYDLLDTNYPILSRHPSVLRDILLFLFGAHGIIDALSLSGKDAEAALIRAQASWRALALQQGVQFRDPDWDNYTAESVASGACDISRPTDGDVEEARKKLLIYYPQAEVTEEPEWTAQNTRASKGKATSRSSFLEEDASRSSWTSANGAMQETWAFNEDVETWGKSENVAKRETESAADTQQFLAALQNVGDLAPAAQVETLAAAAERVGRYVEKRRSEGLASGNMALVEFVLSHATDSRGLTAVYERMTKDPGLLLSPQTAQQFLTDIVYSVLVAHEFGGLGQDVNVPEVVALALWRLRGLPGIATNETIIRIVAALLRLFPSTLPLFGAKNVPVELHRLREELGVI